MGTDDADLSEVVVSLVVSGEDWVPWDLTSLLGIKPTETILKDRIPGPDQPPAPVTEWTYESDKQRIDNLDDLIGQTIEVFESKADALRDFTEKHGLWVTVTCTITIGEELPDCYVSAENIYRLALLGANFSFDFF